LRTHASLSSAASVAAQASAHDRNVHHVAAQRALATAAGRRDLVLDPTSTPLAWRHVNAWERPLLDAP
jgi:hypothetical protein